MYCVFISKQPDPCTHHHPSLHRVKDEALHKQPNIIFNLVWWKGIVVAQQGVVPNTQTLVKQKMFDPHCAEDAALQWAQHVRQLKEVQGLPNKDPQVC